VLYEAVGTIAFLLLDKRFSAPLWQEDAEEQEDCMPLFPFLLLLFFSATSGVLPTLVASSCSPSGCLSLALAGDLAALSLAFAL
jgi:hypothetical protein